MAYIREKAIAIEAVIKAAAFCLDVQTEMVAEDRAEKGDKSPVTIADLGAQAIICQHLRTIFPNEVIVGEESSETLKQPQNQGMLNKITTYLQRFSEEATTDTTCEWLDMGTGTVNHERYWTVDPVDGTKGFLRRQQYAIALALVEDGIPRVGVLACPSLPTSLSSPRGDIGTLFIAVQGEGTMMASLSSHRLNFRPLHVNTATSFSQLRCIESIEQGNREVQQKIIQELGLNPEPLKMDSQAKYGVVARGEAALYLRLPTPSNSNYREFIWDHAAGTLVVEEAGGKVSDMYGQPLDFRNNKRMLKNQGIVVSTRELHPKVIDTLRYHIS